ncbi:luciferase domain-containing protein [Pedobacter rhizosphaerae]|uniref:Luciferase domain-containing protein n=1 Tax=Pedobacter rhizosphaerae TaxID=390241 RepID=A0A1H9JNR2_9SPHI|nr:luciferase family protein [Pedobacter rhizosphaerae]SEQ88534.1 hypothetical protein SAMN04488023_1028 [Pedobacter rhizosphaerae]
MNNSVFHFTVKWLGGLKAVPLLGQVFDSCLKIYVSVLKPELLDWIDEIEREVCSWEDTTVGLHRYGGTQFNYRQKEIGHIHSNGILDVRLNRKTKQLLIQENKVKAHHVFKRSGWISLYIVNKKDIETALTILRLSYKRVSNG